MTAENWFEVEELRSNQEEADTRLILHALHASKTGSQAVIVTAEDTDVMIICLAFSRNIQCIRNVEPRIEQDSLTSPN